MNAENEVWLSPVVDEQGRCRLCGVEATNVTTHIADTVQDYKGNVTTTVQYEVEPCGHARRAEQ